MSDGGKAESKREKENSIVPDGADDFSRRILSIAVAQMCQSVGFESSNESALDSLVDITARYLRDLGRTANFYANLACRTQCNLFDIIQGLEDLSFSSGVLGTSVVGNTCIMSSVALKEIKDYVESAEEIPFAQSVPRFPVVRKHKMIPSFLQLGETPSHKHIPEWLPAFPDPHTYIHTPVWNERVSDPRTDKIELARQRRKAERSLLTLQQRLQSKGSTMASSSTVPEDHGNGLEVDETENPSLFEPSPATEKHVSPVILPGKLKGEAQSENHSSLLETFAPAIESMKDEICDSESNREKYVPNRRRAVCLEFIGSKKNVGESLDLRIRNKSLGRTAAWFGREDEKDDKKRRVEYIIRQSFENQQDTGQL